MANFFQSFTSNNNIFFIKLKCSLNNNLEWKRNLRRCFSNLENRRRGVVEECFTFSINEPGTIGGLLSQRGGPDSPDCNLLGRPGRVVTGVDGQNPVVSTICCRQSAANNFIYNKNMKSKI